MKNWMYILIAIIVLAIVTYVLGNKRKKERAENILNELREERQKLWRETKQKEHLRDCLKKKLNVRSRLASMVMLSTVIVVAVLISLWLPSETKLSALLSGAALVELITLFTSQLFIHKPYEIKYYLGQIQPYLRSKIFANHQTLDEEIEGGHKRIEIIDVQIQRLHKMLAV